MGPLLLSAGLNHLGSNPVTLLMLFFVIVVIADHRVFKLALPLKLEISTELCLVYDLFKKRWCLFVVVRAAHDLADLGQCESLLCRILQEKGRDLDVAEALGSYLEVVLYELDVCIHVQLLDILQSFG